MKTALVTGASSGIGLELTRLLALDNYNLVLISRDGEKLNTIKKSFEEEYKIKVKVLSKDLSLPDAAMDIFNEVEKEGIKIDVLINNAGFGCYGLFVESEVAKHTEMILLNVLALTTLTRLFAARMVERGAGRILNVASTQSFFPVPLMSVYSATKAYVLSFTEAIAEEMEGTGVTVTALCPGATSTCFQERAGIDKKNLPEKKCASAREVAEFGYKAMNDGRFVAVYGFKNFVMSNIPRFFSRRFVRKFSRKVMESYR